MAKASEETEIKQSWDVGLTRKELACIGSIVAHWGALEHEIFVQTIETFNDSTIKKDELPPAMSNLNFSAVLKLWKERVVDISSGERRTVLTRQYERIVHLSDFRNALIHGMWDWDETEPKTLITTRVRRKEIISTKFNPGDLYDFATEVGEINLRVRYPGGLEEMLDEELAQGGYVNPAAMRRMRLGHDD